MQSTELRALLIDGGNTAVKVGELSGERVELIARLPTEEVIERPELLLQKVKGFKGRVGIASVVPKLSKVLRELFPEGEFVGLMGELPVKIPYKGEMGADRVANILGGSSLFKSFIVASLGTATVIDVVVNGEFRGGFILPGVRLMARSLKEGTALLPQVKELRNFRPGNETKECIEAGILRGIGGAISSVRREFLGLPLILTGGDAGAIYPLTGGILIEELTLLGIGEYLKYKGGR